MSKRRTREPAEVMAYYLLHTPLVQRIRVAVDREEVGQALSELLVVRRLGGDVN